MFILVDLLEQRDTIVKDWDKAMEPLREARRTRKEVDWKLWDKLTNEMNIATTKIDEEIFNMREE